MVGFGRGVITEALSPAPASIAPELPCVCVCVDPPLLQCLVPGLSPVVTILKISALEPTKGTAPAPAET